MHGMTAFKCQEPPGPLQPCLAITCRCSCTPVLSKSCLQEGQCTSTPLAHLPLLLGLEVGAPLAILGVHVRVVRLVITVHYGVVVVVVARVALRICVTYEGRVLLPLVNLPPATSVNAQMNTP